MIKHILKIIWNQRRSNGWIFAELLIVLAVLWTIMDSLLVDTYTYYSPQGIHIDNVYAVEIGKMNPSVPGYVPDSLKATSDGEDLIRLMDNLRQVPQVEETAIAHASIPYTWSNAWSSLIRADADSAAKAEMSQCFTVTPSYFDVFRMVDKEGRPLRKVVDESAGEVVISAAMESRFYDGESGMGRKVKWQLEDEDVMTVAAVSSHIRMTEYEPNRSCFYSLLRTDQSIAEEVGGQPQNTDCLMRMKDGFRAEDMESLLQGMSDRLTVGNLYLSSVTPLTDYRQTMLKDRQDAMIRKLALVGFMLVNVFFGIIGTFWLRTQYRKGEMGLRTALGSSRSGLKRFLDMEGLSLLAFTVPLVLIFIMNMFYFDMPDTARLPFTWWRLAIALGGALLLLAGMIIVGVWFPARRIAKMNPAEALHYE